MPGGVVAHTAAHRQTLFLQVNVLPCQSTRLADAQARKVRDLDREQGRVFFSFEKINQQLILPIGNHRDWVFLAALVREKLVFVGGSSPCHIVHRVERDVLFREHGEAESAAQDR